MELANVLDVLWLFNSEKQTKHFITCYRSVGNFQQEQTELAKPLTYFSPWLQKPLQRNLNKPYIYGLYIYIYLHSSFNIYIYLHSSFIKKGNMFKDKYAFRLLLYSICIHMLDLNRKIKLKTIALEHWAYLLLKEYSRLHEVCSTLCLN